MISELFITSLLLFCETGIKNTESFFFDGVECFEIVSDDNDCVRTFKTSSGSFISFYGLEDEQDSLEEKDGNDRYQSSNTSVFQNKYIIMGDSSTYSGTTLTVGKTPILDMNNNPIVYKTVLGLNLSYLPDNDDYVIANAGIRLYKESGNLNSMYCYEVTNLSYSQINGNSNIATSYVDSFYSANNWFSYYDFNITDAVLNSIDNSSTSLCLLLEGHENAKMANIYSSSSSHKPVFYVEYYSRYGVARPYVAYGSNGNLNCHGYVRYMQYLTYANYSYVNGEECHKGFQMNISFINAFSNLEITYNVLSTIGFNVLSSSLNNYFTSGHLRIINSYDDYINDNERRIAFRVKLDNYNQYDGDFHFVCQTEEGYWAAKLGVGETKTYPSIDAPETNNEIWCPNLIDYNSPTLYLAYIEDSCPNNFTMGGLA